MFNVKDDFRPGMPVAAVPAAWFNKVAAALNNFTTDGMILRFTRPDMPSAERPFRLELDIDALRQEFGSDQTQIMDVITDVVWTGTKLQKKKITLTFTYGILTAVSDESTVDIDTAVTYNT